MKMFLKMQQIRHVINIYWSCFSVWFQEKNIFSGMFKKTQKPAEEVQLHKLLHIIHPFMTQIPSVIVTLMTYCFLLCSGIKQRGGQELISQLWQSVRSSHDEGAHVVQRSLRLRLFVSLVSVIDGLLFIRSFQEKSGGLAGIFKKSPKPSPRSIAVQVSKYKISFVYFSFRF